jgi:hypothetical protein
MVTRSWYQRLVLIILMTRGERDSYSLSIVPDNQQPGNWHVLPLQLVNDDLKLRGVPSGVLQHLLRLTVHIRGAKRGFVSQFDITLTSDSIPFPNSGIAL